MTIASSEADCKYSLDWINMQNNETIAAIASGMTASGIGIIRISGPEAFDIAGKICELKNGKGIKDVKSHTIHYGVIKNKGQLIDEALIMKMKGPSTYTAEDTIEIDCHGGPAAMRRVLQAVLENGARTAEPGEFTKRAFLNGRIDLSEAEAVMDVIGAKNEYALKSAVKVLRGSVKNNITEIREIILKHMARIEASLDDPEHLGLDEEEFEEESESDILYTDDFMLPERMKADVYRETLKQDIDNSLSKINKMLENYDNGKLLREGIHTVILGKPNAGKSSLLNVLSGEERAIVTDIEGTTRDILEETVNINGLTLILTDTAGIRDTDEKVEKIGVERAKKAADEADLILFVADGSRALDENDEEVLSLCKGRRAVALINKSDLQSQIEEKDIKKLADIPVVTISAMKGDGIENLKKLLRDMFDQGGLSYNEESFVANERQRQALLEAKSSLELVKKSLQDRMPEDFYAIDLSDAYVSLGKILGEEVGEDVINEVFSRFCMGK